MATIASTAIGRRRSIVAVILVKDICERYGLPYNGGPFLQQLGMVQRTILRLAFPGGKARPRPGPYRTPEV